MGLFSMLHTYQGFLLGIAIWTLGEIPYFPTSVAIIADILPTHLRGTYQGVFQTVRAIAVVAAPALGGFVIQQLGAAFLWQSCFVIGLLVATGYFVLARSHKSHKSRITSNNNHVLPVEVLSKD